MSQTILDADEILTRASPLVHQHGREIQPYGQLIRMPIAWPSRRAKKASATSINCSRIR